MSLMNAVSEDYRGGSRWRVQGVLNPPPLPHWDDLRFSNTTGILPKKTMWFIGVEVEQETSAPPPKKKSWIRPWIISKTLIYIVHFTRSIVLGYHSIPIINRGSFRGRGEDRETGIISGSVSFRSRFGNHFRIGDHFGGCKSLLNNTLSWKDHVQ